MKAGWNKMMGVAVAVAAAVCLWAAMPGVYAGGDAKQMEDLRRRNEALNGQVEILTRENIHLRQSAEEPGKQSGLWMTMAVTMVLAALVFGAVSYAKGLRKGAELQAQSVPARQGAPQAAPPVIDMTPPSRLTRQAPRGQPPPDEPSFRS